MKKEEKLLNQQKKSSNTAAAVVESSASIGSSMPTHSQKRQWTADNATNKPNNRETTPIKKSPFDDDIIAPTPTITTKVEEKKKPEVSKPIEQPKPITPEP